MKRQLVITLIFMVGIMLWKPCKAEYIDLSKGGVIVAQGMCDHNDGKVYPCFEVAFQGKNYDVLFESGKEYAIYLLGTARVLLWSRNSV